MARDGSIPTVVLCGRRDVYISPTIQRSTVSRFVEDGCVGKTKNACFGGMPLGNIIAGTWLGVFLHSFTERSII